MVDAITSRNGRIMTGSLEENRAVLLQDENFRSERAKARAARKLEKAFAMADGLGENGVKDGEITEAEIKAYNKEMKRRNGLLIAAGVVVAGIAAYCVYKGVQANKLKNMTPEQLFDYNRNKALTQKAETAFAEVHPENFKGNGVSYFVDAEQSATPAFKLKIGKTVGETVSLNKEVGLELVQDANGKFIYGVKNPRTGWENLPNWKNEYGTMPFEELKKLYPEIDASKYFCPAGPGMIKANGATIAEDGSVAIQKAYNGVQDIAFQVNSTIGKDGAKNLVDITHVMEDGSAIKFDELKEGWNMVRKGQYNPVKPSSPLPIRQTVVGWNKARDIKTLEGVIHSDVTMTDGGGYPYNKFKDFWKQVIRGKVTVNPTDALSARIFDRAEDYKSISKKIEELKAAGKTAEIPALEDTLQACEDSVKKMIALATQPR